MTVEKFQQESDRLFAEKFRHLPISQKEAFGMAIWGMIDRKMAQHAILQRKDVLALIEETLDEAYASCKELKTHLEGANA